MSTENRVALAHRLAQLPADRQQILQKLLKKKSALSRSIQRRRPGERIPLTFGQQRLWLLDRLVPGNPAYNESNFLHFGYRVDVDALRRAINGIVARHEALRTAFPVIDEDPVQRVAPRLVIDIPLRDLRQLPIADRMDEALRLAGEEARIPFDLASEPLLRAAVYRLNEAEYILALTIHHIISDGWSMGVFVVELLTLYNCFVTKQPSPLPDLTIQYGDFAVWQRRWMTSSRLSGQLAYWRKQLADLPTVEMPTDRPRPAEFTFRGSRCPLVIGAAVTRALLSLCEREAVTMFILLLTAYFVLLHRYTGQDDLAVGSPIAERSRKELQPLIGFFVNTVVLRANLTGDPRFIDLLGRVRETVVAALANQEVPFEQIVDELRPPRDKSRNPLFQIAFQIVPGGPPKGFPQDALLPFKPTASGIAKFDLSLGVLWTETEIKGSIEYNTDLFDEARIERLVTHYERLLTGIVADPSQRISELPILTPAEERRALIEWNATASSYPRDKSIPQVFHDIVQEMPNAPAVRLGDRALSFRELDVSADRAAHKLIAHGTARGDQVGVYLERCFELPVALLSILKAGATFVPLESSYPHERLAYMLSDSGAKAVVTTTGQAQRLSGLPVKIIAIDDVLASSDPVDPPGIVGAPDDLAYLMYTSGTTGRPKGVAVTHRNILRTVKGVKYFDFRPGQTILQFAPISFDASTFEIWGSLLNGATLVLHPPGLPSLQEMGAFIRDARIDALFLTTSLFRQMVETCPDYLRSVGQLMAGGEAMTVATAKTAWAALPRTRVFNVYGPTECTTFSTIYAIVDSDDIGAVMPIGRPIDNTTAYILDKYGNLVPVGVPGELYLGGDGVATGYWQRPDLTAASFLPNRFNGAADSRLYRTGDIAIYRDDGNILFLGRRDRQVKVNGYRIELAEVEASLEAHPDVSCAAAILTSGEAGGITAFVELLPERQQSSQTLHQFLAEQLPPYMVPSHVMVRDKLPLTPVGKLDRDALAIEAGYSRVGGGENAPPSTPTEKLLAQICEELLQAELIGVADNFFELGGHSLAAMRLLSRVRERFQVNVTMRRFFDNATIAGLAQEIEASERETQ